MPWVTGAAILTHVGKAAPTEADEDWADMCAAAIDQEVERRLEGTDIASDDVSGPALAILPMALQDAAALYTSRNAPAGDAEAAAPVGGPDSIRLLAPVLDRYALPGIG